MRNWLPGVCVLLLLAGLICWATSAGAQEGKTPTIKEVMVKVNKLPTSLCPTLGKALKAEEPNWEEIGQATKVFLAQVEALSKNEPPRGDRASWDKLTRAYLAGVLELDAAIQKKDKPAATAAHARIANPAHCQGCHKVHRG